MLDAGDEPASYKAYHYASLDAGDIDPGYAMLRYVCGRFELNEEQRYWLAFLYATCYSAPTVFYIYNEFPDYGTFSEKRAERWWAANRQRLLFQTDRQRVRSRNEWVDVVRSYREHIGNGTQAAAFAALRTDDEQENYRRAWNKFESVQQFGRFAMFLYTEAVHVVTGWPMRPDTLNMREAESCRNGLAFAMGRLDLMNHDGKRALTAAEHDLMQAEFDRLAAEMQAEDGRNNVWNIETTLCAYKKYRLGKRRVGYYLERQRHEIEKMQAAVPDGVEWQVLWDYRKETYDHRWLSERGTVLQVAATAPASPEAAARLRVIAIGGEPATGKTTIMRGLKPGGEPFQSGKLRGTHDRARGIWWLGIYDGDTFDGTDRLSMAVQPDAEAFIEEHKGERGAVIFEGDRLFRGSFLSFVKERCDLSVFVIEADAEAKERRHRGRGDSQSETFLKTQRTKVANILQGPFNATQLEHSTPEDTARCVAALERAMRGESEQGTEEVWAYDLDGVLCEAPPEGKEWRDMSGIEREAWLAGLLRHYERAKPLRTAAEMPEGFIVIADRRGDRERVMKATEEWARRHFGGKCATVHFGNGERTFKEQSEWRAGILREAGATRYEDDSEAMVKRLKPLCPLVDLIHVAGVRAAPEAPEPEPEAEPMVACLHDAMVEVEKLTPHPNNPNTHNEGQLDRLAGIIRANGWRASVTVSSRSGLVVKGHGRLAAAKRAGWEKVPVQWHAYPDEATEYEVMLSDNRSFELGETDEEMLAANLEKIRATNESYKSGYDDVDFNRLLERIKGDAAQPVQGRAADPEPPPAPRDDRRNVPLHYTDMEYEELEKRLADMVIAKGQKSTSAIVLEAVESEAER